MQVDELQSNSAYSLKINYISLNFEHVATMKFNALVFFFVTFSFNLLNASVVFDNSTTSRAKEKSSLNFNHNCSGTDRLLIVGLVSKGGSVSSISYDGFAMTKLEGQSNGETRTEFWYIVSPSTGVNSVSITMSSSLTFAAIATSYEGVDQSVPFLSAGFATGNSGTSSVTISSATDNVVVDVLGIKEGNPTVGTGQTQRDERVSHESFYVSTSDKTGAVSTTMSNTHSSKPWVIIAASLQPVSGSVLPIELTRFYATAQGNKVQLHWETAAELNNDYFLIEQSIDGINFELLKEVNGAGNSNTALTYTSAHEGATGTTYYRLSQIDYDGKTTVYPPISVNIKSDLSFSIYPNPAHEVLNLTLDAEVKGTIEVKIHSMYGNLVLEKSFGNATLYSIPTADLMPGQYIISILKEDQTKNLVFHKN